MPIETVADGLRRIGGPGSLSEREAAEAADALLAYLRRRGLVLVPERPDEALMREAWAYAPDGAGRECALRDHRRLVAACVARYADGAPEPGAARSMTLVDGGGARGAREAA